MCEIVVLQSFFGASGGSDSITAVLSAARPGLTYFFGPVTFLLFRYFALFARIP